MHACSRSGFKISPQTRKSKPQQQPLKSAIQALLGKARYLQSNKPESPSSHSSLTLHEHFPKSCKGFCRFINVGIDSMMQVNRPSMCKVQSPKKVVELGGGELLIIHTKPKPEPMISGPRCDKVTDHVVASLTDGIRSHAWQWQP